MISRIDCACGHYQILTFDAPPTEDAIDDRADHLGWERINGAWTCPKCLGKQSLLEEIRFLAFRVIERGELLFVPTKEREDVLDTLKRLEGPTPEGGPL